MRVLRTGSAGPQLVYESEEEMTLSSPRGRTRRVARWLAPVYEGAGVFSDGSTGFLLPFFFFLFFSSSFRLSLVRSWPRDGSEGVAGTSRGDATR